MRLIDADVFMEELNEEQKEGGEFYYGLGRAKKMLTWQDTVDAAPIKHAHWEPTGWMRSTYTSNTREHEYRCSGCRREKIWKKKTQKLPNYCGNCGAKMDEEKK